MKHERPLILGYDAVSPLGTDLDLQIAEALAGASGIGPLDRFSRPPDFPVTVAGQVPDFDAGPYPFLGARALNHWTSPVFKHALLVTHRALERSGVEITPDLAPRVAVTFSSAIGGLDAVIEADRQMVRSGRLPGPFVNPNSCINMVAGKVSILTGATGPIASPITACATGSTSLMLGAMFLSAGMADVCICGAVDFPLVEAIVAGFATMKGAFTHRPGESHIQPREVSRPFSVDRRGFVVSEGAAAIILASRSFAEAHGLRARHELAGWATTADANHFVAPHRPSIARCMAEAITHAGVTPRDVDAVNAHATATQVGDATEVRALVDVFGDGAKIPPVMANKSQIGHCMGASSAVETVLALESMRLSRTIPTLNYKPDPELVLDSVCTEPSTLPQEHTLKNSFGFGGCNTCLLFRRLE